MRGGVFDILWGSGFLRIYMFNMHVGLKVGGLSGIGYQLVVSRGRHVVLKS